MQSNIKGAIFDLDGTLIHSMGVWEKIDRAFLKKRGLGDDPEYIQALKNMNYSKAAEYTIERYQLKETPEQLMEEWDSMAEWEYGHAIELKEGARELLALLADRGIPMALATASGPNLYQAVLRHHDIEKYFSACTDVSVGLRGKDFPDIYLQAASMIGVEPKDCMVFEDLLMGICVAKAAGFQTCGVYDFSSEKDQKEIRKTADWYVTDLRELLQQM